MKTKWVLALLSLALSLGAWAQSDNSGIRQDTKDAAHSTAKAAKKAGSKVKQGTKRTVHAGAKATRHGAGKVEGKTAATPKPSPSTPE
jgi:hypothetical protein